MARISVAAAKAKGRRLQQKVARGISELIDIPCGKDELVESREMGQAGVDVKLIGKARKLFPYSVEVKNCEKWALFAWLKQAQTNTMKDTEWLLIIGKNHFNTIAVVDVNVFHELLDKSKEGGKYKRFTHHDLLAWRLEMWVKKARVYSKSPKWYLTCQKREEQHVAVMDLTDFWELLQAIPHEVKR